jgi:lipoate-protein ligase B
VDLAAPTVASLPFREPAAGGPLEARWLGRIAYRDAWALQHDLVARRVAGEIPDQLLLLEHPAVLTLGRQADESHVRASAEELAARSIELIRVERGGEVTYHGPGQLVAYPILALAQRDLLLRPLVRALEGAMAETCAAFGVAAGRRDGHPGCWCAVSGPAPRKIGALGIRVERGVTYHGIALNVDPDLADFDLIDPCGMPGVDSTSIARELGSPRETRSGPIWAYAPTAIADRSQHPELSVEWAARVFARALADHIGAELTGFETDEHTDERAAEPAAERADERAAERGAEAAGATATTGRGA